VYGKDCSVFTTHNIVVVITEQAMAKSLTGISGKWEVRTQSTSNRRRYRESHTPALSPVWTYQGMAQWPLQV